MVLRQIVLSQYTNRAITLDMTGKLQKQQKSVTDPAVKLKVCLTGSKNEHHCTTVYLSALLTTKSSTIKIQH